VNLLLPLFKLKKRSEGAKIPKRRHILRAFAETYETSVRNESRLRETFRSLDPVQIARYDTKPANPSLI
jgi:hypothetical protein